jgi:hypothetical protein
MLKSLARILLRSGTMNVSNFFNELKRRNVYKVAAAYAVVAWLLIQAASIFLPVFDAPPWVMKIFIIVVIFGFPVALIFSWAVEITLALWLVSQRAVGFIGRLHVCVA